MGALAQARSSFRRLPADSEQTTGIDCRKADGTKDHPAWASAPIETEPRKYDLVVVLALNPIRDESIILSRPGLPSLSWAATRRTHCRASESEGCHSIAQLIMSDLQTSMPVGDDIRVLTGRLQIMIVCLRVRDGKEAAEQLKAIYPDEAKNAELDITAKFKVR